MSKKNKQWYYAIDAGGKKNIVETWAECEALRDKHPSGARYKKFATKEEAEAYLGLSPARSPRDKNDAALKDAQGLMRRAEAKYPTGEQLAIEIPDAEYPSGHTPAKDRAFKIAANKDGAAKDSHPDGEQLVFSALCEKNAGRKNGGADITHADNRGRVMVAYTDGSYNAPLSTCNVSTGLAVGDMRAIRARYVLFECEKRRRRDIRDDARDVGSRKARIRRDSHIPRLRGHRRLG